jgi:hypothetical protein
MTSAQPSDAPHDTSIDADERLRSRRQTLAEFGRLASMTAPAMLVLLKGSMAHAASEDEGGDTWKSGDYNEHTHRHSNG